MFSHCYASNFSGYIEVLYERDIRRRNWMNVCRTKTHLDEMKVEKNSLGMSYRLKIVLFMDLKY